MKSGTSSLIGQSGNRRKHEVQEETEGPSGKAFARRED